ncbi:MAG: dehydratase [Chloroflexi bacterium]|nr:dehydratase [Chloroflexota bacterium]
MTHTYTPRGHYFEEMEIGDVAVSAGRTITEADIVSFAGLSGDFTQIHTNAEAARRGVFGRRIAHGLLIASIASGLLAQVGFIEETVIALRELTWKFSLPVFIGDTIHAQTTISARKAIPKLAGGLVTLDILVLNQEDKVVQSGQWKVLLASKPG